MRLDVGLHVDDIEQAGRLIEDALGVPLALEDDGELGGAYFEYEPAPLPDEGVDGIRVQVNHVVGIGWSVPERQDLPFVARIGLSGTDILELGRLAASIVVPGMSLAEYVVAQDVCGTTRRELWRAHAARFVSDESARERWSPSEEEHADGILTVEGRIAPVLSCHLTFGVRAPRLDDARGAVEATFNVELVPRRDEEIGGAFYEHAPSNAAVGKVSGLLVRPNAIDAWTRLFPDHADVAFLVDVTIQTQNLLDIGRMAGVLERRGQFDVLAYRVLGDLVRDRVPRTLMREFSPSEVAARRRDL